MFYIDIMLRRYMLQAVWSEWCVAKCAANLERASPKYPMVDDYSLASDFLLHFDATDDISTDRTFEEHMSSWPVAPPPEDDGNNSKLLFETTPERIQFLLRALAH